MKQYTEYYVNSGVDQSHSKMEVKVFNLLRKAKDYFNSLEAGYKELVRIKATDFKILEEKVIDRTKVTVRCDRCKMTFKSAFPLQHGLCLCDKCKRREKCTTINIKKH